MRKGLDRTTLACLRAMPSEDALALAALAVNGKGRPYAERGAELVDSRYFARRRPTSAPESCAAMNPETWAGAMPANVLLRARAIVIAGFANDVEAVNQ
jgi:hypothetical protein